VRWRLRAPGRPTVIIKGQFGSPEFAANYRAAIEGGAPVGVPTNPVGHQGTIAYFARSYPRSAVFGQLAPNTARMRRAMIDEFVSEFGKFPINKLEHRYVRKIVDRLAETPGKAIAMLTAIRALTALALGDGVIASDPCAGIKKPKLRGEGIQLGCSRARHFGTPRQRSPWPRQAKSICFASRVALAARLPRLRLLFF
jgi:hypothetical protein